MKINKIVVFISILFLMDYFTGSILRKMYFNQNSGQDFLLRYSFYYCNSDLIILGNSRAQHHYDTRILKNTLKMTCFNAGMDGGHSILLQKAQLEMILKRHKPKIVILELNPDLFEKDEKNYERLSILLPYYKKLPLVRPLILLRSPYEKIKLLSEIYPFNSKIINIFRFNIKIHELNKKSFDGYVPIINKDMKKMVYKTFNEKVNTSIIDNKLVEALKWIIHICRKNSIRLVLVNSPVFHYQNEQAISLTESARQILILISKEKVDLLDFTSEPYFIGRWDLFFDGAHLNEKGAAIFTRLLIRKIFVSNKLAAISKK